MAAFGDEAYDVPDSTDWLSTPLACFMPVEQAFRCHVCKDFYSSPMLTSCNHTFCSICIRRCLATDGKCPLCRAADQESKLRGNWALREAVDAFVQSRPAMLQFARATAAAQAAAETSSPKRKADEIDGTEEDTEARKNKRPRMLTRSSKLKAAEATAAMMQGEADETEVESRDDLDFEPEDGLVACPICLSRMKDWQVDKHLDTSCPGSPQPRQATASRNTNNSTTRPSGSALAGPSNQVPTPERLPTLAYSMLKDAALRKKLNELGLSAQGSRQDLERRHKEWITIWNANCDSARPKRKFELLHDLDVWERTIGSRAPTASRSANAGAYIRDKDFDGAAWAEKHGDSFRDLIANARQTRSRVEQKAKEATEPAAGEEMPEVPAEREQRIEETPPLPPSSVRPAATVVDLTGSSPSPRPNPAEETETLEDAGRRSLDMDTTTRFEEPRQLCAKDSALPVNSAIHNMPCSSYNTPEGAPS